MNNTDKKDDTVQYAYNKGVQISQQLTSNDQKQLGQFMTPPSVARFMAQRCMIHNLTNSVSVLDPAAGSGVLATAVIENLLNNAHPPKNIKLILYEIDRKMHPVLKKLAKLLRCQARDKGTTLTVSIRLEDFLLSSLSFSLQPIANIIIANPPYFKIKASDKRSIAHSYAVYGQPNIYALFMAACSKLLKPGGKWCFITPRSWTNGTYFSAMRKHLFLNLYVEAMHVFESRKNHFTDDEILQEAMITWATTHAERQENVIVSTSTGSSDLSTTQLIQFPLHQIVGVDDCQLVSLPSQSGEVDLTRWKTTLNSYGLQVSTGPVVAFRAAQFVKKRKSIRTVPFLWMQHIRHMQIQWPIKKKREHIIANVESAWMLVPNANMVLMRRFSPKEDERRVIAAPYTSHFLPGDVIGLENHTNYLYRPGGKMSKDEVMGLAAYLNSQMVNSYLKSVVGNTQINATDLRRLPIPPLEIICKIGRSIKANSSLDIIDAVVENCLGNGETSKQVYSEAQK